LDTDEPSTVSVANGTYAFTDLQPGTYAVAEVPPDGLRQSFPVPVPGDTLFSTDFEGGADGFASSGRNNQWHLSTGRGSDAGHTPGSSFYFGAGEGPTGGGLYANKASATLLSPLIDLSGVSGPLVLEFRHHLEAEEGFDFATVGVLVNGVETAL